MFECLPALTAIVSEIEELANWDRNTNLLPGKN